VRFEERGQGYRNGKKVGKHWCNLFTTMELIYGNFLTGFDETWTLAVM
jgi:hypothetical protein